MEEKAESTYTAPLWRKISEGLTTTGLELGLQITDFAALPARISVFLQFLTDSQATLRQLSSQSWLKLTEGYETGQRQLALRCHSMMVGSKHHLIDGKPLVITGSVFEVKHHADRFLLSLPWEEYTRSLAMNGLNPLVLAATRRGPLLSLIDDYEDWRTRLEPSLRAWGGVAVSQDPELVSEKDLILHPTLKRDLLDYVDRFWRCKSLALEQGLSHRRGLLLAGRPGTGKTQFVRHLFARFPEARRHLFVPAAGRMHDDDFALMLRILNRDGLAAIVVLEDIDQLFVSRTVTPQHLLNVLDGLLALPQVILWVATTNDPALLALNLLDRPGRFDRIVVFPEPAAEERRHMFLAFSRRPLSDECLDAAVQASEGLVGAHIREACTTAALAMFDGAGEYEALLITALNAIHRQHKAAHRYDLGLKAQREPAGFARDC